MNRSKQVPVPNAADKFKKTSPKRLTLIMELVNILVRVVDTKNELNLPMFDQSIHQVAINSTDENGAPTQEIVSRSFI